MTVSLIISTYNWPEALEKSIQSAFEQKHLPDEIIVADDGSRIETKNLIDRLCLYAPVSIKHIWHPDDGFRLSAIRNKAIERAKYDYIVQIDGDIIMDPYFIRDHLALAQQNAFLCGSRVLIPQQYSREILVDHTNKKFNKRKFPLGSVLNSIRLPLLMDYMADHYKKNSPRALRGCNMSFWRKDLLAVNGYNEDIQGWGSEDAEIAIRLMNSGVKKRFVKFGAIAYHIYHKENNKDKLDQNEQILFDVMEKKITWTENGIVKM